jgi:hypothetical protein
MEPPRASWRVGAIDRKETIDLTASDGAPGGSERGAVEDDDAYNDDDSDNEFEGCTTLTGVRNGPKPGDEPVRYRLIPRADFKFGEYLHRYQDDFTGYLQYGKSDLGEQVGFIRHNLPRMCENLPRWPLQPTTGEPSQHRIYRIINIHGGTFEMKALDNANGHDSRRYEISRVATGFGLHHNCLACFRGELDSATPRDIVTGLSVVVAANDTQRNKAEKKEDEDVVAAPVLADGRPATRLSDYDGVDSYLAAVSARAEAYRARRG